MSQRGPSFIFANVASQRYAAITSPATAAGLVPTGLEPSYLADGEPSNIARIATVDPLYTRWFVSGRGTQFPLGAVGIDNVNLEAGGLWRVVALSHHEDFFTTLSKSPNAIVDSANMTGVVGNIDEAIIAPDSTYLTPTNAFVPWSVRLGFSTFSTTPRLGASMGQVVVNAKRVGTFTDHDAAPTFAVYLSESGANVQLIGRRAVADSTLRTFVFPFDFADLADSTGANLEVQLVFEIGEGSGGESHIDLDTVQLHYEDDAYRTNPLFNNILHDSGWMSSPFSSPVLVVGQEPIRSLGYWPLGGLAAAAEAVYVMFADDGAYHLGATEFVGSVLVDSLPYLPGGYIDAGDVHAGPVTIFGRGGDGGSPGIIGSITPGGGIEVEEIGGTTVAGQAFSADSWRGLSIAIDFTLSRTDALKLQDTFWRIGKAQPFYFALEPDIDAALQRFTSGAFTLRSISEPVQLAGSAYDFGDGTMPYFIHVDLAQKL